MSDYLLEGKALCCERDRRVLFENLDVHVAAGEVLQIEGPNGSGKTTLLRVLTGLSDLYEGQVFWQGISISRVRTEFNANIRYLGHGAGIKAALTPEENLRWYTALAGFPWSSHHVDIEDTLNKAGLRGYEDVPCYTLSAGQQRRVNLARLSLVPVKLWILDEPFTAIDKSGVETIENMIKEQVSRGGSVILATHQDLQSVPQLRRISLG